MLSWRTAGAYKRRLGPSSRPPRRPKGEGGDRATRRAEIVHSAPSRRPGPLGVHGLCCADPELHQLRPRRDRAARPRPGAPSTAGKGVRNERPFWGWINGEVLPTPPGAQENERTNLTGTTPPYCHPPVAASEGTAATGRARGAVTVVLRRNGISPARIHTGPRSAPRSLPTHLRGGTCTGRAVSPSTHTRYASSVSYTALDLLLAASTTTGRTKALRRIGAGGMQRGRRAGEGV